VRGGIEVEAARLGAPRVEACNVRDWSTSALYSFSNCVTGYQLSPLQTPVGAIAYSSDPSP
jgi:hypothetical protein